MPIIAGRVREKYGANAKKAIGYLPEFKAGAT